MLISWTEPDSQYAEMYKEIGYREFWGQQGLFAATPFGPGWNSHGKSLCLWIFL